MSLGVLQISEPSQYNSKVDVGIDISVVHFQGVFVVPRGVWQLTSFFRNDSEVQLSLRKTLRCLQHLTKMRRLLLRDALISDEGLQSLRGLSNIEHLDLGGTRTSDNGVTHLTGMTKLKKLSLQGTGLTDDGVQHLLNFPDLEELDVYGTKVSNVGVNVLKTLRKLRTVDLRYTRASRGGVDDLASAIPECEIVYVDLAVRPSIPQGADRMIQSHDEPSVAQWVSDMGGATTVEAGQLKSISLANTSVTDGLLANLRALPNLQKLDLQFTEVSDLGVRHLA